MLTQLSSSRYAKADFVGFSHVSLMNGKKRINYKQYLRSIKYVLIGAKKKKEEKKKKKKSTKCSGYYANNRT